jgi:hypothetical protein
MSLVRSLKPAHVAARCEATIRTAMDEARRSKEMKGFWVATARGANRNLRTARREMAK